MASQDYLLAPGEELLFELNIDNPMRSNKISLVSLGNLLKRLFPCSGKAPAVMAVTNQRILVTNRALCCGSKDKYMWSFPRKALNGNNEFFMKKGTCSCCDSYTISIGLSLRSDSDITFETRDITSVEQAQAVLAKFHELVM